MCNYFILPPFPTYRPFCICSKMNNSALLQLVIIASSCFLKFGEGLKDGERTLSDAPCYCGVKLVTKNVTTSPWKLYVQVTNANNPNMTRTCVGTVIASNVILTSRTCLTQSPDGSKDTAHHKPLTSLDIKDIVVSDNLTKGEGTNYPVTAIFGKTNCSKFIGLQVDFDFTSRYSQHQPICIPTQEELASVVTILGRNVSYEGTGGSLHNLVVKKGQDCDPNGALKLGSKGIEEDVLCVTVTEDFPMLEVGHSIYAEVKRNPREKIAYPWGSFTYLVGISTFVLAEGHGRRHLFFIPINSLLKDINSVTKGPLTRWCARPWAWLIAPEKIKRDKSLDCECGIPPERLQGRIVGGEDAIPFEFPWMVKLGLYYFQSGEYRHDRCGASIINDRLILTAAHCISSFDLVFDQASRYDVQAPNQSYTAFLHSHKFGIDSEEVAIVTRLGVIHPGFVDALRRQNGVGLESDIALLVLNEPLDFNKLGSDGQPLYKPICLPGQGERIQVVGREALVSGWGRNSTGKEVQTPGVLQKAIVTIQTAQRCAEQLSGGVKPNVSDPVRICTVDVNGTHIYSGDSGGPISLPSEDGRGKQTQVGVTSNTAVGEVSFFVDLQEFLPWVDYYADLYGGRYCRK